MWQEVALHRHVFIWTGEMADSAKRYGNRNGRLMWDTAVLIAVGIIFWYLCVWVGNLTLGYKSPFHPHRQCMLTGVGSALSDDTHCLFPN